MKRFFLNIAILVFFTYNISHCQNFYGGISGGIVFSQVDGDTYGGYHKLSPLGGVYVRNTLGNNWEFSLGMEYKRKGSKEVQRNEWGDLVLFYSINLDYIEVPVIFSKKIEKIEIPGLFKYKFSKDLFIDLGLSYGYLIKGFEEDMTGPLNPEYGRPFKKYEIAHQMGITYRFSKKMFFTWRFSYTNFMLPVRNHPGGQTYWFNRGQYNQNQSLILRYEF